MVNVRRSFATRPFPVTTCPFSKYRNLSTSPEPSRPLPSFLRFSYVSVPFQPFHVRFFLTFADSSRLLLEHSVHSQLFFFDPFLQPPPSFPALAFRCTVIPIISVSLSFILVFSLTVCPFPPFSFPVPFVLSGSSIPPDPFRPLQTFPYHWHHFSIDVIDPSFLILSFLLTSHPFSFRSLLSFPDIPPLLPSLPVHYQDDHSHLYPSITVTFHPFRILTFSSPFMIPYDLCRFYLFIQFFSRFCTPFFLTFYPFTILLFPNLRPNPSLSTFPDPP